MQYSYFIVSSLLSFILCGYTLRVNHIADDDCKKPIKDYIRSMSRINFPKGKEVYYMKYNLSTKMRDKANGSISTNIEMLMSQSQQHYTSEIFNSYIDKDDAFVINHMQKVIVWTAGGINRDAELKKQQLSRIQDTLVDLSRVIECVDQEVQGKKIKMITLIPNEFAQKKFKMSKLEYYYNTSLKTLDRVVYWYTKDHQKEKEEIIYNAISFDSKISLDKPVRSLVLNKDNTPLNKYKGYKLVNNKN